MSSQVIFDTPVALVYNANRTELAFAEPPGSKVYLSPGETAAQKRAADQALMNSKIDKKLSETLYGNTKRYKQAVSMFPLLGKYMVTPAVVMAVIRNEISSYDFADERQDITARRGQAGENVTLGYGQISSKGVQGLRAEFPQLDRLLVDQGFPNDKLGNQRSLVNPQMVPYLVAAKLGSISSIYEKSPQGNIKVAPETIVYGYNADVFAHQQTNGSDLKVGLQWRIVPGFKKVFPGNGLNKYIWRAAEDSDYVRGVKMNFMKIIKDRIFDSAILSK